MREPFVGVGTGRCGTNSLVEIVNACDKTIATHEAYQMFWYETNKRVGDLIVDMHESQNGGILRGEVSQACGPHVGSLRSSFKGLKVVCLHRDRESTVESFMNFGSNLIRPHDKKKWVDGTMGVGIRANAQRCFPLIDGIDARQAYGFYWDFYEALMERITEPVMHMQVDELSGDLDPLFDFLEIPECDRKYSEKRKFFTADEVDEIRKEMTRGKSKPR